MSSHSEPIPGYPSNKNGINGLLTAVGAGVIAGALADPDVCLDIVPLDFCVIVMLYATWKSAYDYSK